MPFGLKGAPPTFLRLMDHLLRSCQDFAAAYLDDLIVFSETFDDHLHHVRAVLDQLRSAGLTIKPRKCLFGSHEASYLGHIIGRGTVAPDSTKLAAIHNFPVPTSKTSVCAFLGLAGY